MNSSAFAALALMVPASLAAQSPGFGYATPLAGRWVYSPASDGSNATFFDSSERSQISIHCKRPTHRITISRPASAAAPAASVWTSTLTRSVPTSFNPATGRITAELAPFDPLLDAIAFSRGRFAVGVAGQQAVVVPAWAEVARVIEDCRS